ncbi:hypothetical protein [Chitinophaga sp.]|uniref:hypothetical protein n=1 Tax=Chitinophaga sp. TaxID=1869181 RepID=UPI002C65025B|nr:hypothetical protein [Chitinophaga sp.]HWV69434.1 hypothetical protein [Chitinophaga sp.]
MDQPEKFRDNSSNGYDKEEMKDTEVRVKILEKVKSHLKKQNDVLDFGCATGIIADEIAADANAYFMVARKPEI